MYKRYRIVTEDVGTTRNPMTTFDIYQGPRSPQGDKHEASGFVMENWGINSPNLAVEAAKDLIDASFITRGMEQRRDISAYAGVGAERNTRTVPPMMRTIMYPRRTV